MPGLILERHEITSFFTRLRMASKKLGEDLGQNTLLGRAFKTSNPYRSGEATVWTTTDFDALGRAKCVTTPDGAVVNSRLRRHSLSERLARTGLLVLPCPTLIAFFTWATPLRYMEMRGS
jgi:hypothetical protein